MRSALFSQTVALGIVALLAMLIIPLGTLQADLTGDGLDDLGAYAVEVTGAARGPWYQIYTGTGGVVANKLLGNDNTGHQFVSTPVYTGELTISYQKISNGVQFLQRRNPSGGVLASLAVSSSAFSKHRIFDLEWNGGGARETGVCKTRVADGVTFVQIYRRTAAVLALATPSITMTGGAMTTLDCLAGDMSGNGKMEVVHIFRRNSDGAVGYQVFDAAGGSTAKIALGTAFTYKKAFLGNFIEGAGKAGLELAFGSVRNSDGAALYHVFNEGGTLEAGQVVAGGAWVNHQWETRPTGAALEEIFVGYVATADGKGQYQSWNATAGTQTAVKTVTGSAFTVVEWVLGDFDGAAGNGFEPGLGYIRNSDSFIGFITKNVSGSTTLANVVALNSSFVNPQFKGIRAITGGTDSVWLGAAKVAGKPILRLYNGTSGAMQLTLNILSADVV